MENQEFSRFRNPLDYLKIFFRGKWFIITPAYIGLILGIIACFIIKPTWESSTSIMVEEARTINPLMQNLAISTSTEQRMQSIKEILLSWNSLVELTKKLNLDKEIQGQLEFEDLIKKLRDRIMVHMNQANIIKISYQSKNRQEAQLVAKTLTDILIERNMQSQTKETDVAIDFIKEQLAIYKRKIKESEIAELDDQLKKLLIDSTEQHPMVKELNHKISVARKELESGEYEVKGAEKPLSSPTQEALKQELDKMINKQGSSSGAVSDSIADSNNSIYKLILMDKVESSVARDLTVNQQIYNMLLQRLETAKITQRLESSKEGTRYTILEPARFPLKPVKPKKIVLLFMGLFLGTGAGVGFVFVKEMLDQSFLDINDAKQSLELPILGAISRLTTQEEINNAKYKIKTRVTFGLISGVSLVTIFLLIYILKK